MEKERLVSQAVRILSNGSEEKWPMRRESLGESGGMTPTKIYIL